jgi:archaetidylinositol phosphate synthase
MLSRIQHLVEGHFQRAAGAFHKSRFSPNSVTFLGFLLTIMTAVFYATGLNSSWLILGAVLALLIGAYLDAVDGAMARRYHQISKLGGILDSVLDRVGEIFLYSGLLISGLVPSWLALWALSASLMVSYIRARVDVEGVKLKGIGIAERPERLLILLVATIFSVYNFLSLEIGVGLIALLSTVTMLDRLYRTRVVLSVTSVASV